MAESSILFGETDITTKLQSLLGQAWSSQHFGCSTPPGVGFLNTQSYQIIFLHPWGPGFLRAVGRLFARSKGGKAPGPLGPWKFQLFFYRAVWTWVHQKRHSRKTFGASKHIILVPHQICKGMINPKKDDTPSNLWYPGLLSDPYRDEMRDDSWRMAEFESSSKPALASLKATGERKQSRSRLQVTHWEGGYGQDPPGRAPSRNMKRQRQAVWSLKALGNLTDPAGCCMLMGTFEYTEPLMACTSFRGAMGALGAYFRQPSSSKAGPEIWFTLWYSNMAMGNRLQIWKFSWGIPP